MGRKEGKEGKRKEWEVKLSEGWVYLYFALIKDFTALKKV